MKNISFLLGAGFSTYAKIADRKHINEKLKNLKHDNFIISSVGIAYLIEESVPNSNWQNISEREFIEYFISRYVEDISDFDYETFYDYCISLHQNFQTSEELDLIYTNYKKIVPHYSIDKLNSMSILIGTINQLIDDILFNNEDILKSGILSKYSNFIKIINYLIDKKFTVNIFTLNHDLLLEKLLLTSLNCNFNDGFQFEQTPYHIRQNDYQFRIKYYTNNFSTEVNIFKLHGSIDNYIVDHSPPHDMVKIPKNLNLLELYREKLNSQDNIELEHLWTLYTPSFLSGNSTKIVNYKSHQYYIDLFNHFENKLENSESLICIGYGLGDIEINKKISKHFNDNKKILVVKPSKGDSNFYKNENIIHFGEGKELKDLSIEDVNQLLS